MVTKMVEDFRSFKDVLSTPSVELCESLEGITGMFTNCLFSSSRFIAIF